MTVQAPPLDIEYNLSTEEANLLKPIVGIQDDEELKRHILEVRSEAYSVCRLTVHWTSVCVIIATGLSLCVYSWIPLCEVTHLLQHQLILRRILTRCCKLRFRITKHPAYQYALKLGKERENAIFLELPCCGERVDGFFWCPISQNYSLVGGDSRVTILDGYPKENVLASDLLSGKHLKPRLFAYGSLNMF